MQVGGRDKLLRCFGGAFPSIYFMHRISNSAILLCGIYPGKHTIMPRERYVQVFIAAWFTIEKS